MKRILPFLLLLAMVCPFLLTGCDVDETNALIAAANTEKFAAFADGMVACGDNAACQVAIATAFAGGLGQQQIFRPDTIVDYLRAGLPYGDLSLRFVSLLNSSYGVSGDRSANVIKGDGNTLLIGNRTSGDNGSTVSLSLNPSYHRSYDGGGNRNYTGLQPITDEGLP